jgi:hypothetical protein
MGVLVIQMDLSSKALGLTTSQLEEVVRSMLMDPTTLVNLRIQSTMDLE